MSLLDQLNALTPLPSREIRMMPSPTSSEILSLASSDPVVASALKSVARVTGFMTLDANQPTAEMVQQLDWLVELVDGGHDIKLGLHTTAFLPGADDGDARDWGADFNAEINALVVNLARVSTALKKANDARPAVQDPDDPEAPAEPPEPIGFDTVLVEGLKYQALAGSALAEPDPAKLAYNWHVRAKLDAVYGVCKDFCPYAKVMHWSNAVAGLGSFLAMNDARYITVDEPYDLRRVPGRWKEAARLVQGLPGGKYLGAEIYLGCWTTPDGDVQYYPNDTRSWWYHLGREMPRLPGLKWLAAYPGPFARATTRPNGDAIEDSAWAWSLIRFVKGFQGVL